MTRQPDDELRHGRAIVQVTSNLRHAIRLHRNGDLAGAQAAYRAILDENGNDADALHYLGLVHYQKEDLATADALMSRALGINPRCANTLSDLGMVKVKLDDCRASLPLFTRALQLNPNHTDALNNMATALKKLHRFDQIVPLYRRLSKLKPYSAETLCELADAQYRSNSVVAAIADYQRALRLDAGHKRARVGLGDAYESMGKFAQAKQQYLSVLRRDENSPLALSKLLQLRDDDVDQKWVAKARQLVASDDTDPDGRIRLNVALGYYYDRQESYDRAFRYLELGCNAQFAKEPFNSRQFTKAVDSLIEVLTKEFFRNAPTAKTESTRPIFIVGMPRSGTTLTEQILSSHSQVAAGGELSTLLSISYRAQELSYNKRPYPYCLTDIGRIGLTKLARRYLERLDKVSMTASRVTDKLPFNFMHIGMIALLFPNAKIIHCHRHPLDNCLSCYFTSFSDQVTFASNQETLGQYYRDYWRLMRHWFEVLGGRLFDLEYEKLVTNTESCVRSLLSYCELGWEDACLNFHQTQRDVRTPSRWQVRQPIYASSMHRWRNYEAQLQPLYRCLQPILDDADE